jgi:phage baseplate assembly protein W
MPQYLGFSTINANKPRTTNAPNGVDGGPGGIRQPIIWGKKFALTDEKLVIQDFLNALNIRLGEKVGQPQYGTTLWDFVFEPNTIEVQGQLETELRRVANLDPRLQVNTVKASPVQNGILVELQVAVAPFNNPQVLSVFFNSGLNSASLQ